MAVSFRGFTNSAIFRPSLEALLALWEPGRQGPLSRARTGTVPRRAHAARLTERTPKDTARVRNTNALHERLSVAQRILYNEMFVMTRNKPD